MIDFETVGKFGTLLGVIVGARTAFENLTATRHKRLKDDYELAKVFFGECSDEPSKKFVEDCGFQALSGISDISAVEARRLIALDSTGTLLRDYKQSKPFIVRLERDGCTVFAYQQKYANRWARQRHQIFHAGVLLIFSLLAIASGILLTLSDKPSDGDAATLLVGLFGYVGGAIYVKRKAEGLLKAAKLVNSQTSEH